MLKDFRLLATRLTETFHAIEYWPEITFNEKDIKNLSTLSNVTFVNEHSIQLSIEGGNHTILPSQYILYAIYVKELALNVKEYVDVFEQKKKLLGNNNLLGEQIIKKLLDYSDLPIDDFSKIIGPTIFMDESMNLGAKSIVNGKEGNYNIRGIIDFFGSIILKPINIPNASSSILGKFIYNLSENVQVYDYFEKRFIDKLSFIFKTEVLKKFCFHVVSFLYSYDNLKSIENLIQKNNDINYCSIKDEEISLTTIFKVSKSVLNSENLMQGGTLRFFEVPIFYLKNEFYYFSTEWTGNGSGRLDFESLKLLVEKYYPEFKTYNNKGVFTFESSLNNYSSLGNSNFGVKSNENIIYYGAPGTGKSHKVNEVLVQLNAQFYERITFHPEFDHSSFVGGYRPKTEKDEDGKDVIRYKFVPQSFTNIYVRAWNDPENQYYLAIEEINRGNCAEIFGDLFQLLDRNCNYTISPSNELGEYLTDALVNKDGLNDGLKLPPNLTILATMNTSDQSLFPMDSAFKRRWDWEYIPICYNFRDEFKEKNDSFDYEIDIEDGQKYSWIKFIEKVNLNHIKINQSLGMDKCIGNYFIKPDKDKTISLKPFINKVIFYLWNDVFKDEDNKVFKETTSYEDFFPIKTKGKEEIKELFKRIELTPKTNLEIVEEDPQLQKVAESDETEGL